MALQTNKKKTTVAVLVNISRVLLGIVLVVSGFVKAVDPMGLFYKLGDYAMAFGVADISDAWLQFFALLLCGAEFVLGVLLFLGVYRRPVTIVTFLFFLLFTPFTLIIALWNPVRDCGCFGDAIHLSNWATFGKNVLLLVMSTLVAFKYRLFVCRVSRNARWMVALFAICYVVFLEGVALSYLPAIDFRPFAVGANLREATVDIPSEKKSLYKFEKDGVVMEFGDEDYPDSTWNYLGSRDVILKEGRPALIADFSFVDDATGEEFADIILSDSGYVGILVMERLEVANESRVDKINDMYDLFCEHEAMFYATTSSSEENILLWRKRTGAEYPILWADNIMLKTMIRSNPGFILIKDGLVVAKWNGVDMPEIDNISKSTPLESLKMTGLYKLTRGWNFWLLLFVIPIFFIVIIDRLLYKKPNSIKEKNDSEK